MYGLLALLALPAFVLSSPVDVSAASSNPLEKRVPVCNPRFGGVNTNDCLGALLKIPRATPGIVRQFSMDPLNLDAILLPQTFSFGECTIGVSLTNNRDEASNWRLIKAKADAIINTCVRPSRSGGTERLGARGEIEVTIYQYSEDENDDAGPDPAGVCKVDVNAVPIASCLTDLLSKK
ncbi:MAG: hypothetical protein M1817_002545 [Caeruleum heppii]|nr:MAG: hypothetical protein M1817_002545 [Caeruleum heppii]